MTAEHPDTGDEMKAEHDKGVNDQTKPDQQTNRDNTNAAEQFGLLQRYMLPITTVRNYGLLTIFLGYYSYAMYCHFGDEASIRLTVCTGFGILYVSWSKLLSQEGIRKARNSLLRSIFTAYKYGARPKIIRWCLYLVWTALLVSYLIVNVALKDPRKLRSLAGFVVFILILVAISNNRRKINWHCVFWGSAMQCLLGFFVIKTTAGATVISWFSDRLTEFMDYSKVGAKFVFGDSYADHRFAMQAMPSIIVFFAAIQVLIYLGTVQCIVRTLGRFIAVILDVSAPEATNACANIFLGGIESAILVIEYIDSMPTSRLFTLVTNWFASCGGSALIQFISFGVPAEYLLAASAMSAPAALVCAKITFPDVDQTVFQNDIENINLEVVTNESKNNLDHDDHINSESGQNTTVSTKHIDETPGGTKPTEVENKIQNKKKQRLSEGPKSIGEALVAGTKQGIKLVANIIGNMIVALSVVEFLDKTVEWFGERVDIHISLKIILSYAFYPFVYVMGIDEEDCLRAGEMLGIRTISMAGISYQELGKIIENRKILLEYTAIFNETITYERDNNIFLPHWNQTLEGGVFSSLIFIIKTWDGLDRYNIKLGAPEELISPGYALLLVGSFRVHSLETSELIVSYALCGFASVPMIGMTLGALTTLIPDRAAEVTNLAFRALIAGTIASYLTACAAEVFTSVNRETVALLISGSAVRSRVVGSFLIVTLRSFVLRIQHAKKHRFGVLK